jgi:hypothetical protein
MHPLLGGGHTGYSMASAVSVPAVAITAIKKNNSAV